MAERHQSKGWCLFLCPNPHIRQNKDLLVKWCYQIQGGFLMGKELENQKSNYVTQGDYCLPCIRTKEQTELHR